jgi:hypothetical protein
MPSTYVPGFSPSRCGFRFDNNFPSQPLFRVPLTGLWIGNASRGLCGGMVFAACDYFARGWLPPDDVEPPAYGSPLFRYLVHRLFESFRLPWGPLRYYRWMGSRDDVLLRSTVQREWPRVRRELDAGRLAALGLIRVHSRDPLRLGENHQVLSYGYDLHEKSGSLQLAIYDPSYHSQNNLRLALNLRAPDGVASSSGEPFRGFFHTPYCPGRPETFGLRA